MLENAGVPAGGFDGAGLAALVETLDAHGLRARHDG